MVNCKQRFDEHIIYFLSTLELDWVCMFVSKLNNNINYMVKGYNTKTIFEA